MKLFGWGKSKDPQPQTVLRHVKKTDPSISSHGLDRAMSMGHAIPCKSTGSGIRKQQGLFGVDDDGYLHGAKVARGGNGQDADCDEKSQSDTIRFVFSHERQGLLAIGTFALEQLTKIRDTIDNHQNEWIKVDSGGWEEFESCTDMMQSSDDEDQLPHSLKRTCDLPVYGSEFYTSGVESEAERESNEEKFEKPADQLKALTLYQGSGNRSPVAGTKPIVLPTALPPELRKTLDPASPWLQGKSQFPTYVSLRHWTDSVPSPGLPKAIVDQEHYSSYFCGLFGSKKKSSRTRSDKSKRISQKEIVHIDHEDSENLTIKPIDRNTKNGVPSLGKLAKLWRSSCKQSSARIASERKVPCSPRATHDFKGAPSTANDIKSGKVLTTPVTQPLSPCDNRMRPPGRLPSDECSPKVAEFRRRMAMHERNMGKLRDGVGSNRDDGGHWIKTDSEYVVLEM